MELSSGRALKKPTSGLFDGRGKQHNVNDTPSLQEKHYKKDGVPTTDQRAVPRSGSSFICPICKEVFGRVLDLNSHIEHGHSQAESNNDLNKSRVSSFSDPASLKRHTIKLDLLDNMKGFGLSDNLDSSSEYNEDESTTGATSPVPEKPRKITRAHWVQPMNGDTCSENGCGKLLNVKNGIVNCRRCGKLYCNAHTHNKVKLSNSTSGDIPVYDASLNGLWCRCCIKCYGNKPDLREGTQVRRKDLTAAFVKARTGQNEKRDLQRNIIEKRFIKLVNLHAALYLEGLNKGLFLFLSRKSSEKSSDIASKEKEIVAQFNWQKDNEVSNCNVCLERFTLLIRKHHCRLCGKIVCDDPFGQRLHCSLLVPLGILIEKLPFLNYSSSVRQNLDTLIRAQDEKFSLRCCCKCKDNLLHEWKIKHRNSSEDPMINNILLQEDQLLICKAKIERAVSKLESIIQSDNIDSMNNINCSRGNIMNLLKELESFTSHFRSNFFYKAQDKMHVKEPYLPYKAIVCNIHVATSNFLQQLLIQVKELSRELKEKENSQLKDLKTSSNKVDADVPAVAPTPALTRRQVRELRETLMVMSEQRFLVETQIADFTKHRKFDELAPLMDNKKELDSAIKDLEAQLGDEAFNS